MVDVVLNFCTGFIRDTGEVELNLSAVARHYARTYFVFDLFTSFPFDMVSDYDTHTADRKPTGFLDILRFSRAPSVLKILRMVRVGRMLRRIETRAATRYGLLVCFKFVAVIAVMAHWLACSWFKVGVIGESLYGRSWLTHVASTGIYDLDAGTRADAYIISFYWCARLARGPPSLRSRVC